MHDLQAPPPRENARRKLVRGVFAAPAIMTVCSGSAFAAASGLRCIANQANSPLTEPVTGATDTWLRVQLYSQGGKYYVRGSDIGAFKRSANSVYLSSNQWQAFDISTNTAGAITTNPPGNPQPSNPPKYVAVRVDASGNIVGVGATGSGSAVAGTCWNSFAMMP